MGTKQNLINATAEAASSGKMAGGTATVTMGTGLAQWLAWIPDEIGKLGVLMGALLSAVLIYVHLRRWHLEGKTLRLDYRRKRIELAEAEARHASGKDRRKPV